MDVMSMLARVLLLRGLSGLKRGHCISAASTTRALPTRDWVAGSSGQEDTGAVPTITSLPSRRLSHDQQVSGGLAVDPLG